MVILGCIRIRECAELYGFVGERTLLYDAISAELSRLVGRPMPPNIDGGFAVAGLELGLRPIVLGPLFALSLLPGTIVHVQEEIEEHEARSVRRFIDERINWEYVGPSKRHLPAKKIEVPLVKVKLEE